MTDTKKTAATVTRWFEEGIRCFQKTDGIAAFKAFQKVIQEDPTYRHGDGDNAYFYLGKIHEVEGRLDDAVMMYSQALAIDPEDEESLIGRGSCLTVKGQYDQAVVDFRKVLSIDPRKRRVPVQHIYYAIAENRRKQGDLHNALIWAHKAQAADPQNFRHQQLVSAITAQLDDI